jgi:hypothetical protein
VGAAGTNLALDWPYNGFVYQYDYSVVSPNPANRTWGGDVFVLDDVNVPAGGTLTIDSGANVKVFNSDLIAEGADPSRVEFNINGGLSVNGTVLSPVFIRSLAQKTNDDWAGIYFSGTSSGGSFVNCQISGAETAIESYASLTLKHSTIRECGSAGVVTLAGGALVQDCTFVNPGSRGIDLQGGDAEVRNTLVDGALDCALKAWADPVVVALKIRNSEFSHSGTGLYVQGPVAVSLDSTCYFYANDIGVHLYDTGSPAVTIRDCGITWSTNQGILCDHASPHIVHNVLAVNGAGIYCSNYSSPIIEDNEIQSSGFAVTAASNSSPDVGHTSPSGTQSPGNNKIAHTGKYVVNYTNAAVYARNNCWDRDSPNCNPPSSMFTGSVYKEYPQCCDFPRFNGGEGEPQGQSFVFQLPSPEQPPKASTALLTIVPNPFNPITTIQYSLAVQAQVEIRVYDVSGRLVKRLANDTQPGGVHAVTWKGTDNRGSSVASGIYFVRMDVAGQVFTKKMVLLK